MRIEDVDAKVIGEIASLKRRFCCMQDCLQCPISVKRNGKSISCIELERKYPEKYGEIILAWWKENKPKTKAELFFERYPNAPRDNFQTNEPDCPYSFIYGDRPEGVSEREAWAQPVKDWEEKK